MEVNANPTLPMSKHPFVWKSVRVLKKYDTSAHNVPAFRRAGETQSAWSDLGRRDQGIEHALIELRRVIADDRVLDAVHVNVRALDLKMREERSG